MAPESQILLEMGRACKNINQKQLLSFVSDKCQFTHPSLPRFLYMTDDPKELRFNLFCNVPCTAA